MKNRNYCATSGAIFSVVAIAHLLRIINGLPVQVDYVAIPMTVSWGGLIVAGSLAAWAFRSMRKPSIA